MLLQTYYDLPRLNVRLHIPCQRLDDTGLLYYHARRKISMESSIDRSTLCPVCGYQLGFRPWDDDLPSDEICPSCGIQFGYDDAAAENPLAYQAIYQRWREKWLARGLPWFSRSQHPPQGWDPVTQLQRIGM